MGTLISRQTKLMLRIRDALTAGEPAMCRNIKTLYNFEPPATDAEIRAAALQFVRKISGFTAPSAVNRDAFDQAVDAVADAARRLVDSLETSSRPRDREIEALKARQRSQARFGGA